MTYNKTPIIFLYFWLKFVFSQDVPLVLTTQGLVSGLKSEDGKTYMYLGIPFGVVDPKNPFGPSSPAPVFEGIFNATDDSAVCPQEGVQDVESSINCLHLNVFVPSTNASGTLLPVLAFIHGGAFVHGSYDRSLYGPKYLVRHGVILITFNYRLGPYGYMCTDNKRVPGNEAMKDQLLALKWINENIESFGGDPNKVTLSGNSAGGMSIDLIISSDQGPQYFQQVILQSGVSFLPSYPPTVRDAPLKMAEHLGLSTQDMNEALDFLASVSPTRIILAGNRLGLQFRPCIERKFEGVEAFMTENWVSKDTVPAKDLNIIVGFTDNEALGLFLRPNSDLTNIVEDSLINTFVSDHEDFTGLPEVRHFFFGDEELDYEMFKEAIDLRSDNSFVHPSIRALRRFLKSGAEKVYLYLFTYDGKRNLLKRNINTTIEGAAHADELGYLFDVSYLDEPNEDDQLMIDRITEMWTNFAKYGNPTPQPTTIVPVKWKPVTSTSPLHYIHLDSELKVSTNLYNERISFWDLFLETNENLQRFIVVNKDFVPYFFIPFFIPNTE